MKEENNRYRVIFKADSFLDDLKYGMFEEGGWIMPIGFQPSRDFIDSMDMHM